MEKSEIDAMSFNEKLAKLQAGIFIPPPDRIDRKLNEEKVFEIASQYITRGAFKKDSPTAYRWACRHNVIDEMCEHMVPAKRGRKS